MNAMGCARHDAVALALVCEPLFGVAAATAMHLYSTVAPKTAGPMRQMNDFGIRDQRRHCHSSHSCQELLVRPVGLRDAVRV